MSKNIDQQVSLFSNNLYLDCSFIRNVLNYLPLFPAQTFSHLQYFGFVYCFHVDNG